MLRYGWLTIKIHAIYTYLHHILFVDELPHAILRIYIESEGNYPVYMSKTFESDSARWIKVNDFYKSPRIPKGTLVSVEIMSADQQVYVTQRKLTEFV